MKIDLSEKIDSIFEQIIKDGDNYYTKTRARIRTVTYVKKEDYLILKGKYENLKGKYENRT